MKIQNIIRLNGAIGASLFAWALLLSTQQGLAQANGNPPNFMTYQGYLVDGNGNALGTNAPKNYDVIFRIWDASSGGTIPLWAEQQTVTVDKGYFSVLLGEGSSVGQPRPALNTIFTNNTASERWVGVTVKGIGSGGADADILPRLRLLTSPYSFLASRALTVDPSTAVGDGNLSANVALRNATQSFTGVNTFSNAVRISGANTLEFGAGVSGKQTDAGKIGYQTFTAGALDIVGAGTNTTRKIQFWNEGGANFTGPITATSYNGNGTNLTGVATLTGNNALLGNLTVGRDFYPVSFTHYGRLEMWSPFGPFYGAGLILRDFVNGGGQTGGIGYTLNGGEWSTDAQRGDITVRSVNGKLLLQSGQGASAICINTANQVGIGTASPQSALHVRGNGNQSQLRIENSANSTFWHIYSESNPNTGHLLFVPNAGTGGFLARNSGSFLSLSDARLKTDIAPLGSLLDRVLKLKPVSYRFKSATDAEKTVGFIAQEVEPLFPELVSEANGYKGLAYSQFAPITVAAIQELHQVIRKQETALSEKSASLNKLEQEVNELKKQVALQAAELQAKDQERDERIAALERLIRDQASVRNTPARD